MAETAAGMSRSAGQGEETFSSLLRALKTLRDAQLAGVPSDRALARAARVSPTTVGSWLAGAQFPQDVSKIVAVVRAVAAQATAMEIAALDGESAALLDEGQWRKAHQAEARRRAGIVSAGAQRALAAGWPLAEVMDPVALEVHRPVPPDRPQQGLSVLPTYVQREHDALLERVVRVAAEGRSGIAVVVGGSSTGKTRACWEALGLLRDQPEQWRLWHPIDPARPDAVLRELPSVAPRTVVWLNEAQFYLEVADGGLGEQVAAGLRELLRDPGRAPVLVLATLWPQSWAALTASPDGADLHAQARELLVGHDISVPTAFTAGQVSQLARAKDARLALAAGLSRDGQVIQFLAGAPELLARYRNAPPAAAALIHAAMDARRLGMGRALPYAFLKTAAPGYLTDSEWDRLEDDWMEQALAYTAAPCAGARGPLARIRPRPTRTVSPSSDAGPTFVLADYLDHIGRRERRDQIPPNTFWDAAISHIRDPADAAQLADSARNQLLYRYAIPLRRHATARGEESAAWQLAERGDLDEPRTRADTSDKDAAWQLARLLAERGDLDELRARADTGDKDASGWLAGLLAERGDLEEAAQILRPHADGGDKDAAWQLAGLLAERGDLDEPRAQADTGWLPARDETREPRPHGLAVSFWEALDHAEREALSSVAFSRTFAMGERLMGEGEPANYVAVIIEGRARIYVEENGWERVLAERGPGQLVGERGGLEIRMRSANVIAIEPVLGLVVTTKDFSAFISAHPRVLTIVEAQLNDRLTEVPAGAPSGIHQPMPHAPAALALTEAEQRLLTERPLTGIPHVLRRAPELAYAYGEPLGPDLISPGASPEKEPPQIGAAAPLVVEPLSEREREVLTRLSGMHSTAEIAAEMYISVNTVKTHLRSIYRKLASSHRSEAIRRARQLDLI